MTAPTRPSGPSSRDDRGQVTLWMLGLSLMVLAFGVGGTVEAWRVIDAWRRLAAASDAAAVAGASGIDEDAFRASGGNLVQLDPAIAEQLAYQSLAAQGDDSDITGAQVTATTESVTVVVHGQSNSLILGALRGDDFTFTATSTADPRIPA